MSEKSDALLLPGKITGWKYLTKKSDGFVSHGSVRWVPGQVVEARCPLNLDASHVPPVKGCTCGIYVLKSREVALSMMTYAEVRYLAEVRVWGRVIEHDLGYRAQFAELVGVEEIVTPKKPKAFARDYALLGFWPSRPRHDVICAYCGRVFFASTALVLRRLHMFLCPRCFAARAYAVYNYPERVMTKSGRVSRAKVLRLTDGVDVGGWLENCKDADDIGGWVRYKEMTRRGRR